MSDRDTFLKEFRGETLGTISAQSSADELFQNQTIRPILKLQNDLFIAVFINYAVKQKNVFFSLTPEKKMDYIDYGMKVLNVADSNSLPTPPEFQTIYISGGKKNKLNKIDIVGFFSQKGKLEKGDLGLIEVKDFISFAAVKSKKVKT
jgi:hypothetical protein